MNSKLRQAMDEFERERLQEIPTLFGRIIYMASLWEPGTYHEPLREERLGSEAARIVMSRVHGELIGRWLRLAMQERHDDIRRYLAVQEDPTEARTRLQMASVADLLPSDLSQTERDLFLSEFRVLLAIIRREEST